MRLATRRPVRVGALAPNVVAGMSATERTLRGPAGYRLVLDSAEVFPDDPGAGTPALVYCPRGRASTYFCAIDTGEVDGFDVPDEVHAWLLSDRVVAAVDQVME